MTLLVLYWWGIENRLRRWSQTSEFFLHIKSADFRGSLWNQLALFDIDTSVAHLVVDQIHNENSFKLANFVSTGYQWHKIHFVLVYGYFFSMNAPFSFPKTRLLQDSIPLTWVDGPKEMTRRSATSVARQLCHCGVFHLSLKKMD